ncbi:MAG: hypothetical protein FJ308_16495 [Planctomycetes bacterium]|nr:hypothetical protein [Planctomycetota bacterium]
MRLRSLDLALIPPRSMRDQGAPPASVVRTSNEFILDGDLQPRTGKIVNQSSKVIKSVVFSQALSPINSNELSVTLSDNPDSLATSSESGPTILAVVVEAIPQ